MEISGVKESIVGRIVEKGMELPSALRISVEEPDELLMVKKLIGNEKCGKGVEELGLVGYRLLEKDLSR